MEIDLHGYSLVEAQMEVSDCFQKCIDDEDNEIIIVHGWKQGQVLKNYFRSNKFLSDMKKEKILITKRTTEKEGETKLKFVEING